MFCDSKNDVFEKENHYSLARAVLSMYFPRSEREATKQHKNVKQNAKQKKTRRNIEGNIDNLRRVRGVCVCVASALACVG